MTFVTFTSDAVLRVHISTVPELMRSASTNGSCASTNGSGQNGMDKMVYGQNSIGQNGTDKMVAIFS